MKELEYYENFINSKKLSEGYYDPPENDPEVDKIYDELENAMENLLLTLYDIKEFKELCVKILEIPENYEEFIELAKKVYKKNSSHLKFFTVDNDYKKIMKEFQYIFDAQDKKDHNGIGDADDEYIYSWYESWFITCLSDGEFPNKKDIRKIIRDEVDEYFEDYYSRVIGN